MRIVTGSEMRNIEDAAEKAGVSRAAMMEKAGRGVAAGISGMFPDLKKKRVCVLCGKGNNGGDGLVAARHLKKMGVDPLVFILGSSGGFSGLAKKNLVLLKKTGLRAKETSCPDDVLRGIRMSGVVIDAIFGTGFRGEIEGSTAVITGLLNKEGPFTVSVDVPSGLDADTGRAAAACVRADRTFTLGLPKKGLMVFPGTEQAGIVSVLDIGIPPEAEGRGSLNSASPAEMSVLLGRRKFSSHKGSFGHILAVAGSAGMPGAAVFTVLGAVRSGAGLVTAAVPESIRQIIGIKAPEAMIRSLKETEFRSASPDSFEDIMEYSKKADAVVIGPGISRNEETCELARKLIENVSLPMVIDADAIFALKGRAGILKKRKAPTAVTPHPGEMVFLAGGTVEKIQADRINSAASFAAEHGVVVVLKGARTVIASPEGEVWINPTGNPGMAAGGSGDVLAGVIASLAGRKLGMMEAAVAGAYAHGFAGDIAAGEKGETGMTASDIADKLAYAFKEIVNK